MTRPKSCGEYAGTHAGVNRHRKAWERPCDACREFGNAYQRQRRSKGAAKAKARADAARRNRALQLLVKRHRSEYLDLLREVS